MFSKLSTIISLLLSSSSIISSTTSTLTLNNSLNEQEEKEYEEKLTNLINKIKSNPEKFIEELSNSEFAALSPTFNSTLLNKKKSKTAGEGLPLVFLHGMGDSCFNNGMSSLTKDAGDYKGVYSTCIPTGDTRLEDTLNGFFLNMDANVDVFAEKVRADPNLANGFNCVGLSQGNNICRGYIQRYNDPVVNTHLSIHGPLVGVAALPHCYPDSEKSGSLCVELSDLLSKLAYTSKMQDLLFQANYFRDVNYVSTPQYKLTSQMGNWNNEDGTIDKTIKTNFAKTNTFAMIKANEDSVVVPREGEWWGAYDSDYKTILTMKETSWYQSDSFGLKTADAAGKIYFESTDGNHLDFTDEQLYSWLDKYC